MFLGTKRKAAAEFSFLLAVPTMLAATGLDLIKTKFIYSPVEWLMLTVGFLGAFIVALISVKLFLKYVQRNNFIIFGVYRIVASILFYLIVIR
jgi:undecaprenyl-diphosphatase